MFIFFACPKKTNQKKRPFSEEFFKQSLKTVWQTSRPFGPVFEALLRPILLKSQHSNNLSTKNNHNQIKIFVQ
jgi:hypothetical protein